MAKNWSAAEAAQVVFEGKDKAAIQDIGKRFPLFVSASARGAEGLLEIIGVLHPERITVRTIESKLKEGIEEQDGEEEAEDKPEPKKEKPVKKEKPAPKKGKGKKKPEPVEEEEEEEEEEEVEEEDGDGFDDMTLPQLRKLAKKEKINVKGMSKDEIISALRGEEPDEEEDEDEDEDWDL